MKTVRILSGASEKDGVRTTQVAACALLIVASSLLVSCMVVRTPITREKASTPSIPIAVVQMPDVAQKGGRGTFSVRTDRRNTCLATIEYADESGTTTVDHLAEAKADEAGLCTWTWTVPMEAMEGAAVG